MARENIRDDRDYSRPAQTGAFNAEHWLAWLMVLLALGLGAIGLLVGFGMLGTEDVPEQAIPDAAGTAVAVPDWHEGMLWMLPAIAAGLLAMTLHETEHHTRSAPADKANKGMFGAEHVLAYLGIIATIAAGALTLLIGFDVFDDGRVPEDGFLWGAGSVLGGVVSAAFHRVRHHQMVAERDEDYIVKVVEERIRMAPVDTTGSTTATSTGTRPLRDRPLDR